ncbi:MAG: hypothetical protein WAO35_20325 [Terriglobia bacterium]
MLKRIILAFLFSLLLAAIPAWAQITLLAHTARNDGTTTTAAINTTGATLLVAVLESEGSNPTVSDSQSNTWNYLSYYTPGAGYGDLVIAYSYSKSGGALSTSGSHTFTVASSYPSIAVTAWSGTLTTSAVYDSTTGNGAYNSSTESLATGSTGTLSGSGELVISGWGSNNSSGYSVSSLAVTNVSLLDAPATSSNENIADAYIVEASTSAVNATWSWTAGNTDFEVAIAVFKPSSSAAVPSVITGSGTIAGSGVIQ